MQYGYNGKVLRVDLSSGDIHVDKLDPGFCRRYLGGRGFISYYLLNEVKPKTDPLSPQNILIFSTGPLVGIPAGGCGRNSVGAKSPLTEAYGDAEAGGYFGVELKNSGYDMIILQGKSPRPVYLWINNGRVELREATHLWGKTIGESQKLIHEELGDSLIRTAQIGPAGENMVRFACIMNDLIHAAGRCGLGAVMGSKNIKAIAVRGHTPPEVADYEAIKSLARWLRDNVRNLSADLRDFGTGAEMDNYSKIGKLPTHNFQESSFYGAHKISAQALKDTIRVGMKSCYACPIRCKKVVKVDNALCVDPIYGGPHYETLASFGSCCGIDDLVAIAKANEISNAYGVDTISAGVSIAFAMECFERGLLNTKDCDGVNLSFGNAQAMLQTLQMICDRRGRLGDLLAEGSLRASHRIGGEAMRYAMQVKGQEIPMHEPRYERGLAMGYVMSPTGADHCHNIRDTWFSTQSRRLKDFKAIGILEPLPRDDLSAKKVRMSIYFILWRNVLNSLVLCQFVPWNIQQIVELVKAATGWNTTAWEMAKVGERCANMMRAFNLYQGFTAQDDSLPLRFFVPITSGPLKGVAIDRVAFEKARETYYSIMGWDCVEGVPNIGKLQELDIEWVRYANR